MVDNNLLSENKKTRYKAGFFIDRNEITFRIA